MVTTTQTVAMTCQGTVPLVDLAKPTYSSSLSTEDMYSETFQVNALTPTTLIGLGPIVTGKTIWIQTSSPITVTLTQNAVGHPILVDSFLLTNATFTALELANADLLVNATVTVVITGNRTPLGVGPGVY